MNKKIKPLTEKDEIEDLVNCIKKKLYLKEDVLSALALAKDMIAGALSECMDYNKVEMILDECFKIQEQGKVKRKDCSEFKSRSLDNDEKNTSQDFPAQNCNECYPDDCEKCKEK